MFIPTTADELKKLGWTRLDVIIVSGDTYIDSYYDGAALIGKILINAGYKVGIIAQPDIDTDTDIIRLGEPALFWGVTGGCVDSMVANYTALKKKKRSDDLTPGGENNKRPDRAVIAYCNLIKKYFKSSKPIVIGGVEASLRRIAHYDYWDDSVRRSVLFDSKANVLVYGMADRAITELAEKIKNGENMQSVRGLCYISKEKPEIFIDKKKNKRIEYIELPSFEAVKTDKNKFIQMFHEFYKNNDPLNANGLIQKHGDRYLVQNPPSYHLTSSELDIIYEMDFERDVHPYYKRMGKVTALDTIKFSITSQRGCYGECNFCSITVHQGRIVISRSEGSILKEAEKLTKLKGFKGYISDIGGPTANMYGNSCKKQMKTGSCKDKRCLSPDRCVLMDINHDKQINLLKKLRQIHSIKKVFIGSGLRYDLVVEDLKSGEKYLSDIITHHISGQMKIAPEHSTDKVLKLMAKPTGSTLSRFIRKFYEINKKTGLKQYLTYYFIAAHPGCEYEDMEELSKFISKEIKFDPEQVQVFTPTPSTYSTLMYYTGTDPFTNKTIFVETGLKEKRKQKDAIMSTSS